MESEKVKEIKEWLEEESKAYRNEIACRTLDLINELESERSEVTDKNYKLSLQIIELLEEKMELKDRIAELEKSRQEATELIEIAMSLDSMDKVQNLLEQAYNKLREII